MPSNMTIPQLNDLRQKMVGDSQLPNVFFVSVGNDTQLVSTDFNQAYVFWKGLSNTQKTKEPAMADRIFGVICSVEKGLNPEYPHGYTVIDCSQEFLRAFCLKGGATIISGA